MGRIRIYVNGDDVTTSSPDVSSCYAQPGEDEDYMTPWSDMNEKAAANGGQYENSDVADDYNPPGNPCANGDWCASPLSIGGLNWSDTNNNFIGGLDEVKVWNITKDAAYFDSWISPSIVKVSGAVGCNELRATMSEGV